MTKGPPSPVRPSPVRLSLVRPVVQLRAVPRPGPPAPAFGAGPTASGPSRGWRHGPPAPGVVQRYAWAVLDSREEDNDIVRNNLSRFLVDRNIDSTTDTDISGRTFDQVNSGTDPVHLHGHGSSVGFAGLTPQTLASKVQQKFGHSLKSRSIVFHSCEIGQGNYLRDFLLALIGSGSKNPWKNTRVFGATNLLVVNNDGISQVARDNVTETQLKNSRNLYFSDLVEKKARGWRVAFVSGGSVQVQDVTPGTQNYKILKDCLSKP